MRPAEFTSEAIIRAGQELQAAGRNITSFALRQKVGGGNPSRLKQIWDEHTAVAAIPPALADWESIAAAYRAGQVSVRAIAAAHRVTEIAIRRHAAAKGWERDLSDAVRQRTRSELARETAADPPGGSTQPQQEIVATAAAVGVAVVLQHRRDIARLREQQSQIAERLAHSLPLVQDLSGCATAVQALDGLSRVTERIIRLERQAFSLDDAPGRQSEGIIPLAERLRRYAMEDEEAANVAVGVNTADGAEQGLDLESRLRRYAAEDAASTGG
ncbi:MAG: putative phage-like protein [Rhodospirillaceae bacterium]|nr:MAG: putative phage-like protein [Rhodospirillaceae bacterium]